MAVPGDQTDEGAPAGEGRRAGTQRTSSSTRPYPGIVRRGTGADTRPSAGRPLANQRDGDRCGELVPVTKSPAPVGVGLGWFGVGLVVGVVVGVRKAPHPGGVWGLSA